MEFSSTHPASLSALVRALQFCRGTVADLWRSQHKRRTLLVKETAALGERRFVAVIQFEQQRFLIGGSPGSITLLANLPNERTAGGEL